MKKYVVFSQRTAGYLQLCGFVIKKIETSNDGSGRNVFIFNDSDELREKINQYDKFIDLNRDFLFR